ncbi:MAG: lipid A biosynthesis acyltransferase [Gillisia sp.]
MQGLVFWLVYPVLWLISRLPFPIFYKVSDLVFFLVYHVIRYRRKTVKENLELVFPEKSSEEIRKISIRFYSHMCDMFLEMIKSISISNEELKRRFTFSNIEEIEKIRKMDKSIIMMCGHYASFEWMNALQLYGLDYKGFGIYKKIQNRYFNKMAQDIRGRFDAQLIPTTTATKTIAKNQKEGVLGIYGMVADQSPKLSKARNWTEFLGNRAPVFMGAEKLAKDLDMAVIYLHVEKVGRGYYQATFIPITSNPKEVADFKITNDFLNELEKQIHQAPEYYLWTHKRWKHRNAPVPKKAVFYKRN